MSRRLVILDLALVLMLALSIAQFRQDWLAYQSAHQVSAIQPMAEDPPSLAVANIPNSSAADWTEIASRDPFSFDRNDIPIVAVSEQPKVVGPRPILFGTMSLGDGRIAMVGPGQPGNRSYRPMKVGEVIDGWSIAQIDEKSIVVEANAIQETVVMNDPSAQLQRDHTRTLVSQPAPNVVQGAVSSSRPAPAVTSVAPVTTPTPSTANSNQPPTRYRELQTPFGVVRQPMDDPGSR